MRGCKGKGETGKREESKRGERQRKERGKKNSLDLLSEEKKFVTLGCQKNYALISKKASASGGRPPTGALALDPTGGLPSSRLPHFTPLT